MPAPVAMVAQLDRLQGTAESLNVSAAASVLIGRLGAWSAE